MVVVAARELPFNHAPVVAALDDGKTLADGQRFAVVEPWLPFDKCAARVLAATR